MKKGFWILALLMIQARGFCQDSSATRVDSGAYIFLAGGHWYGAQNHPHAVLPAASLYAALDRINRLQPRWIFALGDVVRNGKDPAEVQHFRNFSSKLETELHIIPGNHDLDANGKFNTALGRSGPDFHFRGDLFLFLNTESLRSGGGKAMLQQIGSAKQPERNLFVFSHRLFWALAEPGFPQMDEFANQPFRSEVNADTVKMIYDALLRLAGTRNMYWFSGDVGVNGSEPVFYDHSPDGKRHFFAAGIADSKDDALWKISVDDAGKVKAEIFSLIAETAESGMSGYGMADWEKRMQKKQEESTNANPGLVRSMLSSLRFWAGIFVGALIGAALAAFWRKTRKRAG